MGEWLVSVHPVGAVGPGIVKVPLETDTIVSDQNQMKIHPRHKSGEPDGRRPKDEKEI